MKYKLWGTGDVSNVLNLGKHLRECMDQKNSCPGYLTEIVQRDLLRSRYLTKYHQESKSFYVRQYLLGIFWSYQVILNAIK